MKPSRSGSASSKATAKLESFSPLPLLTLSALTLLLYFLPGGPFVYLPPTLSLFLVAAGLAGWWLHWMDKSGKLKMNTARTDLIFESAGLFIVLSTYLILKSAGLHASQADDNIYFYMAEQFRQGLMPYRDFFFAHPPVHLLVPAAVFSITGFSIEAAKSIPMICQGLAAVFIYLALRPHSKGTALLAMLIHLSTYEVLMGSTDMNGENIMTLFLAAAFFAVMRERYLAGGVLAGIAFGSGLYAMAVVMALGIASFIREKRKGWMYVTGFVGFTAVLYTIFALIAGKAFFDGVILFHLSKPVKGSEQIPVFDSLNPLHIIGALFNNLGAFLKGKTFDKSLYFNSPVYIAVAGAAGWLLVHSLKKKEDKKAKQSRLSRFDLLNGSSESMARFGVLVFLLFLFQWAALNEIYDYYMVPMFAFLSIPSAVFLHRIYSKALEAGSWNAAGITVLMMLFFCLHPGVSKGKLKKLYPEEWKERGQKVEYTWKEQKNAGFLSQLNKSLFFHDERTKGEVTPFYRHYIWNKSLTFSTVDSIAAYIAAHTAKDETIGGASTITPLIALTSGRRIAADEIDTNTKRFATGSLTDKDYSERILKDKVRFIVSSPRSHFTETFMQNNPYFKTNFEPDTLFMDPQLVHFKDFPIRLYRLKSN
jgi:hypothetical protein